MPQKDPEAARRYQAEYRAKHREKAKAIAAEWRAKHPGRNAENAKRWREANPEKAAAKQKEWRAANRERVRQKQREWRERTGYNQKRKERGENTKQQLRTYGLTVEDYEDLLRAQGGVCAICASPEPGMKRAARLYVDHCHNTNRVRGLLCRACNTMLGCVRDDPELLRAGASYLERQDDSSALRGAGRGLLESS